MIPLRSMGVDFEIRESVGPVVANPIREARSANTLRVLEPEVDVPYVLEAIRILRRELDGRVPLIGFAGAPFTLASYLVEGRASRDMQLTKRLMYCDPAAWHTLMGRLADTVSAYLLAQIRAGAQAVQLFDSWVGALSPRDYREYVLPHSKKIFDALAPTGVPRIHFGTGTATLLEMMKEAGGDTSIGGTSGTSLCPRHLTGEAVPPKGPGALPSRDSGQAPSTPSGQVVIGIDWRVPLAEAWNRLGQVPLQGNLDPAVLLATPAIVETQARQVLAQINGRRGHIFNLGHGVLPETPVENVERLVEVVHSWIGSRSS
jgi:uroporphyrinogen decarboxylase